MKIGKTSNNSEGIKEFKRFVGIMPVKVLAVNPTKDEYNKIFESNRDKDFEYIFEYQGEKFTEVKFVIANDEYNFKSTISFILSHSPFKNKDGNKVQVIDEYGRTAWVTSEQYQIKGIPVYSNGPAKISGNYQMAYRGQEDLIKFLKYYLGIKDINRYDSNTGTWVEIDDPSEAEIQFNNIKSLITKGDMSEIKSVLKLMPDNMIKVALGVKITSNGVFQYVFNREFMRNTSSSVKMINRTIDDVKANGGLNDVILSTESAFEYNPANNNSSSAFNSASDQISSNTNTQSQDSFDDDIQESDMPF